MKNLSFKNNFKHFLSLVGLIFFGTMAFAGSTGAVSNVFYSVSPFGTGTIETGAGNISITSGVATLTVAQTGNIGVGVAIEYNALKAFIAPNRIGFDSGGTTELLTDTKIEGATSGATGIMRAIELTSGTWAGGDAAGWIYFEKTTGTFQDDELINRTKPTSSTNIATINGTIKGNIGNGNTEFVVKTAVGADAANQAETAVTSIHHEYASLFAFEAGFIDANHINRPADGDLTVADVVAHATCYYDHDDQTADEAPVTIDFGTTDATRYLVVYTPVGDAESVNSQRHNGKWKEDGAYRWERTTGSNYAVIDIQEGYVKIVGLQIYFAASLGVVWGIQTRSDITDSVIEISHNIIKATPTGTASVKGICISYSTASYTAKVWNNIIYGMNNIGIHLDPTTASNSYVYNNTVYNCSTGIHYSRGTSIAKNNITQNCTNGYGGTFDSNSTHNISDDDTAPAYGTYYRNTDVNFLDASNDNFHLAVSDTAARDAGTDLSLDANLSFFTDIDSDIRSGTWDIGVDEYIDTGPDSAVSPSGSVLDFDGSDYLSVADDAVLDQNDRLSLSVWAKPDTERNAYIVYRANAYYLKLTDSCTVEGAIYHSAAFQTIISSVIACDGSSWSHLELTYDKDAGGTNELKLYINGVLSATGDHSTAIADTNTALYLGAQDFTPSFSFDGKIDDFKLYQYARTVDEVGADYNAGKAAHLGQNNQRSDGLVGHWNFEEGSGQTISDRSGNGNDGTLGANSSVGKDDPVFVAGHDSNGLGGMGMSFDGVDDYVNAGNILATDGATQASWSFWTKPSALVNSATMLSKNDGNNAPYSWRIGLHGTSGAVLFDTRNFNQHVYTTTNPLAVDTWSHIVVIYDGSQSTNTTKVKIYVNGVLQPEGSIGTIPTSLGDASARTLKIGAESYSSSARNYFNGSIDEVRIYNRALSADEIRMLYNQKKPIFHAKMDEGSGQTAYDESFNNNDGTLTNMDNSDWVSGKFGTALDFDGGNDYVGITDPSSGELDFGISTNFTVEAWFKSDTINIDQQIIDKRAEPMNIIGYYLYIDSSNKVNFGISDQFAVSATVTSASSTVVDVWYHAVGVTDRSGNLTLYLNSIQDGTSQSTAGISNVDNSGTFWIGRRFSTTDTWLFSGIMDDVRIYNYARTAEEIRADYNAGKAAHLGQNNQRSDGLVGHWTFEEGSGQTISDRSGNGNDGTLGASDSVGKDDPVFVAGHDSSGPGGMGMSFDGVGDYVDCGTIDITGYTRISYSVWFKADILDSSRRIVSTKHSGGDDIRIWVDGSNIYAHFDDGTVSGVSTSFTDTSSWHHITTIYDGSTIRLYLDGLEAGTPASDTFDFAGSDGLTNIGRLAGGSAGVDEFNGLIDEVRIYNRALSADEIRMLYNQKKPIFHAKMDEGSGQVVYDESFNNNDGTLGSTAGSDANDPTWTTGKFGSGLSFDGVNDYVDCGDNSNLKPTNNITVAAWAKSSSVGNHDYILSKPGPAVASSYALYAGSNEHIYFFVTRVGSDVYKTDDGGDIWDGNWHYIVGTYNASEVSLYIDGVEVGTPNAGTLNIDYTNSDSLIIGAVDKDNLNYNFSGEIDDVRIYNYARTAEEILVDYNAGVATHFN